MKKMLCCAVVSLPLIMGNLSCAMDDQKDGTVTIRTTDETQISIGKFYLPCLQTGSDGTKIISVPITEDTFNKAVMPLLEIGLAQRKVTQTLEGLPTELLAKTLETGCLLKSRDVKDKVFDVLRAKLIQSNTDFIKQREKAEKECAAGGKDAARIGRENSPQFMNTVDIDVEEFVRDGLQGLDIPQTWWGEIFDDLESDLRSLKEKLVLADMMKIVKEREEREKEQEQIQAADDSKQKLREIVGVLKHIEGGDLQNGVIITELESPRSHSPS